MATPFKLKSGNTSTFKNMGSSPMYQEKHFLEKKKSIPMETHEGGDPSYKPTLKQGLKEGGKEADVDRPSPITPITLAKPRKDGEIKTKVTKGDVLQTLIVPRVNIPKTLKVMKHYTPPKIKEKVKKVIKKGKSLYGKAKKYLQSPA